MTRGCLLCQTWLLNLSELHPGFFFFDEFIEELMLGGDLDLRIFFEFSIVSKGVVIEVESVAI